MAVAPTFFWAAAFYVLRALINSLGMPIRQSYVVGVAEENNRSAVAALSNLPSQLTSSISPSVGAYLMEEISMAAPYYVASAVLLLNAWTYYAFFHREPPPEEREQPTNTHPMGEALGSQPPLKGRE
jgi:predicted MFS family arabinose efflux permease